MSVTFGKTRSNPSGVTATSNSKSLSSATAQGKTTPTKTSTTKVSTTARPSDVSNTKRDPLGPLGSIISTSGKTPTTFGSLSIEAARASVQAAAKPSSLQFQGPTLLSPQVQGPFLDEASVFAAFQKQEQTRLQAETALQNQITDLNNATADILEGKTAAQGNGFSLADSLGSVAKFATGNSGGINNIVLVGGLLLGGFVLLKVLK